MGGYDLLESFLSTVHCFHDRRRGMGSQPVSSSMVESAGSKEDHRPVFFFDIDNCLYSRSTNVHELMQDLINDYFIRHLSLSVGDAHTLHQRYYKDYGLAVSGLAKHHKIDPLNFNREVDDALPLDDVIKPNPRLQKLLDDIDKTTVKLWLFTNAHITHAQRVIRLLGVQDMFEGITYCNYGTLPLLCKPHAEMYEKAEKEAEVESAEQCFFVDDSYLNCRQAQARGWTTAHLVEPGDTEPEIQASKYQIRDLEELRGIFPHFFSQSSAANRISDPSKEVTSPQL